MRKRRFLQEGNVLFWFIFSVTYFLLATISIETRDPWSLSSNVWLPAGLLLGVLCTRPSVEWPKWTFSAGILHFSVSLLHGRPWDIALAFAVLDLLIIFPLSLIWNELRRYSSKISPPKEMLLLLAVVYFVSASGGIVSDLILKALGYPILFSHFINWGISNATGCLAIAPVFITHHLNKGKLKQSEGKNIRISACALLFSIAIFLLPSYCFGGNSLSNATLYLVLILSLLTSVLLPLKILTLYFTLLTLLVSLATIYGYGPFQFVFTEMQAVVASQLYLLMIISLGLLTAAREQLYQSRYTQAQQQQFLLKDLLQAHHPFFFHFVPETECLEWKQQEVVLGLPVRQLANLKLLLAHVHPDDRFIVKKSLCTESKSGTTPLHFSLRFLLPDADYHRVKFCLLKNPQQGVTGVLALMNVSIL